MSKSRTVGNIVSRAAILLGGASVYGTTSYLAYQYIQMSKKIDDETIPKNASISSFVKNPDRNKQYQNVASYYDDEIGRDEFFLGINLLRRCLLYFHAKGTVLEVAAGTGRNLNYYPNTCQRVLLVDSSDQMLQQMKNKMKDWPSDKRKRFAVMEAEFPSDVGKSLPDQAFDTVVDTFGLCSFNDPVASLQEMARVCKPDGKVILLEHGRSKSWDFITNHLDKHAETHAKNWGCVWNRDLDQIIADSGCLDVEILSRYHFGTTYYVVCRPKLHNQTNLQSPTIPLVSREAT